MCIPTAAGVPPGTDRRLAVQRLWGTVAVFKCCFGKKMVNHMNDRCTCSVTLLISAKPVGKVQEAEEIATRNPTRKERTCGPASSRIAQRTSCHSLLNAPPRTTLRASSPVIL